MSVVVVCCAPAESGESIAFALIGDVSYCCKRRRTIRHVAPVSQ